MAKTLLEKNSCTRKKFRSLGFTLVELSLSITFIAILSITITLMVTNAISSYRRGITLNSINTTGMDLVDDIRSSIQNSSPQSVYGKCDDIYKDDAQRLKCEGDKAYNFISVTHYASVKVGGIEIGNNVPVFGAFCTGSYSYIWNSGYFFNTNNNEYKVGDDLEPASFSYNLLIGENETKGSVDGFKLLKIKDDDRLVCISAVYGDPEEDSEYNVAEDGSNIIKDSNNPSVFDITKYGAIDEEPSSILAGDNLAIYDLSSSIPAENASKTNLFYSVSFILGTIQGGINVKASGNYCATPGGYDAAVANFDYCAINKFNFAAQATGGKDRA